jgi:flagellar hook assembly protein FlgD
LFEFSRPLYYPRTITPNGDHVNDIAFFLFENPTEASLKGTIYDLNLGKVADASIATFFKGTNAVLSWDGKDSSGIGVPGGVYLYKIEIGDQTFTGTMAVMR